MKSIDVHIERLNGNVTIELRLREQFVTSKMILMLISYINKNAQRFCERVEEPVI